MRLLLYHIQNFGKLRDIKGEFGSNLTVIKEDNSFGKTTLADFVISMFYGLPDLKVRDLRNERRRYDPWQGGIFGGSIIFEHQGRRYQAERDFGKNIFRLYDVTAVKKEISSLDGKRADGTNLGEILFEIDKNSFKKSAYIPQDDIVCSELESGLNDKLRNIINAADENHSLDDALRILQKAADTIETKRGKGRLPDIEVRIAGLREKISECRECAQNAEIFKKDLDKKQPELEECQKELAMLDGEIQAQSERKSLLEQQSHYRTLKDNIERDEKKIREVLPFFRGQDIGKIDLKGIKDRIEAYRAQLRKLEEKEFRYKELQLRESSSSREEKLFFYQTTIRNCESEARKFALEKEEKEKEIQGLERKLKKYGGFLYIFFCVLTLGLFFFATRAKKKRIAARIASLRDEAAMCGEELYGIARQIVELKAKMAGLDEAAREREAALNAAMEQLESERKLASFFKGEVDKALSAFSCTAADPLQCYFEIEGKYSELAGLNRSLAENKSRLDEFLKGRDEEKLFSEVENASSLEILKNQLEELDEKRLSIVREITELEAKIGQNEQTAENLGVYESELAELEEKRAYFKEELDNIKSAMEFLKEANDSLANLYLLPLLKKSREIIKLYDEEKAELEIEADYKIRVKENGMDRELDYYSKGIKEIISVCMRIALIEVIYAGTTIRPFIILDDPFANLDDKKLVAAKEFIKKLSEKYQIIYLTCHDSRTIAV